MFSLKVVKTAVAEALEARGLKYPVFGFAGVDNRRAKIMAFDAIRSLTGYSITGAAVEAGASGASGRALQDCLPTYATAAERADWIAEVRTRIMRRNPGKTPAKKKGARA